MPSLYLRPPVAVMIAATARASDIGISRHLWITDGLDWIAGGPPRFAPGSIPHEAPKREMRFPAERTGRIKLNITTEQIESYERSATACHMPVATWATVVLGVLAGVSDLGNQLRRI